MSVTARHDWHHDLKQNCTAYKESLMPRSFDSGSVTLT